VGADERFGEIRRALARRQVRLIGLATVPG
jgi:hypothetical protein